jgi:hypothetical protein
MGAMGRVILRIAWTYWRKGWISAVICYIGSSGCSRLNCSRLTSSFMSAGNIVTNTSNDNIESLNKYVQTFRDGGAFLTGHISAAPF